MPITTRNLTAWSAAAGGSATWRAASYANAQADDAVVEDVDPVPGIGHSGVTTDYLIGKAIATPLPALTLMNSVSVKIKRRRGGGPTTPVNDLHVYLVVGTALTGVNRATATNWTSSFATEAHVFTTADLLTLGINPYSNADFNAAGFGATLRASVGDDSLNFEGPLPEVDHLFLEFDYSTGLGLVELAPPLILPAFGKEIR